MDNKCYYCSYKCLNFANNLVSTYFDYWLAKVEIIKDPTGFLKQSFDNINFHRMEKGINAILLNYGNGITLTTITDLIKDKNNNPIYAQVQINYDRFGNEIVWAIDWKLFKKENKLLLEQNLKKMGLTNTEIIETETELHIKSDLPIFKCIFFENNRSKTPSLEHLLKIIFNIHELSDKADKNRALINTIYYAKTGKKLTSEQANNISITKTLDGYGISIVDDNDNDLNIKIQSDINTKSLNNWDIIQKELEAWETKFQIYSGMSSEKLSNQRENLGETLQRASRVNALEKQYYKYIKKFFDEYEEYFSIKLEYQFDELVTDTIKLNANQQKINNTPKQNTLTEQGDNND